MYPHDRLIICLLAARWGLKEINDYLDRYGLPPVKNNRDLESLRKPIGYSPTEAIKEKGIQSLYETIFKSHGDTVSQECLALLKHPNARILLLAGLQLEKPPEWIASNCERYLLFRPSPDTIEKFKFYFWDNQRDCAYRIEMATFVRGQIEATRKSDAKFMGPEFSEILLEREGLRVIQLGIIEELLKMAIAIQIDPMTKNCRLLVSQARAKSALIRSAHKLWEQFLAVPSASSSASRDSQDKDSSGVDHPLSSVANDDCPAYAPRQDSGRVPLRVVAGGKGEAA